MPAGMTTAKNAWPADPEKYDLLRGRMGGWTEFFVTMFPRAPGAASAPAGGVAGMLVAAEVSGADE
jgi:hypothetical protein